MARMQVSVADATPVRYRRVGFHPQAELAVPDEFIGITRDPGTVNEMHREVESRGAGTMHGRGCRLYYQFLFETMSGGHDETIAALTRHQDGLIDRS